MENYRRKMLDSKEVADILNISQSYAYKIIDRLNKELEKAGYLTIRGKIDSLYLDRRFFPDVKNEEGKEGKESKNAAI